MKKSLSISFALAILLLLVPAAFASTLTVNTGVGFGSTWNYEGYTATFGAEPGGTGSVFNLTPTPGTWAPAIGGTSWMSFAADSAPGGAHGSTTHGYAAGYYWYDTTFTTSGVGIDQILQIMADDTAEVWLDGSPLVTFGAFGTDYRCADNLPNCTKLDTVHIGGTLAAGSHKLVIIDDQAPAKGASGIDASYSVVIPNVATTPEPGSLLLLGSGLLGLAFVVFRRSRAGAAMNLNM